MLGMTIYGLIASKEAAQTLSSLGHAMSYNTILQYNNEWLKKQPPTHKEIQQCQVTAVLPQVNVSFSLTKALVS